MSITEIETTIHSFLWKIISIVLSVSTLDTLLLIAKENCSDIKQTIYPYEDHGFPGTQVYLKDIILHGIYLVINLLIVYHIEIKETWNKSNMILFPTSLVT